MYLDTRKKYSLFFKTELHKSTHLRITQSHPMIRAKFIVSSVTNFQGGKQEINLNAFKDFNSGEIVAPEIEASGTIKIIVESPVDLQPGATLMISFSPVQ